LNGRATPEGTARYRDRIVTAGQAAPEHFRLVLDGLALSSIGLGTYLGQPEPAVDQGYRDAIREALALGGNVIDTAVNYRFQRSERAVGAALAEAVAAGAVQRDEVFVSTKGGYAPFDGGYPADPDEWIAETFIRPGIAAPEDFVEGHCMTPAYLEHQVAQSRANLRLETLDLYYVHNPEGQRPAVGPAEFARRLRAAFEALEAAAGRGEIAAYGTATWNGYRQSPTEPDHLSLAEVVGLAREAGGPGHHFRAVQLPYNLAMPEAYGSPTQVVEGETLPLLAAAARLGVSVFASASLLQSRLARRLPAGLRERLPGCDTDAQRALQFSRSAPGLATALVGMSQTEHARENLALAGVPPLDAASYRALFR
jgi:aryl-alcohol dehydrogenase-like predicted oxidoreductase